MSRGCQVLYALEFLYKKGGLGKDRGLKALLEGRRFDQEVANSTYSQAKSLIHHLVDVGDPFR